MLLRDNIIGKLNDDVWEGHLGDAKLLHCVQEGYCWARYSECVMFWYNICQVCLEKVSHPLKEGFQAKKQAKYPMQVMAVDIMDHLPESDDENINFGCNLLFHQVD